MMDPVIVNIKWLDNVAYLRLRAFVDQNGAPINFTGSTFKMEIRSEPGPTGTLIKSLTTANSGILSTDLTNGKITVSWAKGDIAAGSYVYDLLQVVTGGPFPLMKGALIVEKGVTQ